MWLGKVMIGAERNFLDALARLAVYRVVRSRPRNLGALAAWGKSGPLGFTSVDVFRHDRNVGHSDDGEWESKVSGHG